MLPTLVINLLKCNLLSLLPLLFQNSALLTIAYNLKSCSQIESAAIYSKVQEGDATMLIQGSDAWTKKEKYVFYTDWIL